MRETRWRVVEPNGRSYPPGSQPLRSYEAALRRVAYYSTLTRATGEGRLPRLPLSIEWQQVECGPWNGHLRGLDLVSHPAREGSQGSPCCSVKADTEACRTREIVEWVALQGHIGREMSKRIAARFDVESP